MVGLLEPTLVSVLLPSVLPIEVARDLMADTSNGKKDSAI